MTMHTPKGDADVRPHEHDGAQAPAVWNETLAAQHLRHASHLAEQARAAGHHPFAALLVAPDGRTVLAEPSSRPKTLS